MMFKRCTKCNKRIKINEKCDCARLSRNESSKRYREKNKEYIKMLDTAKWKRLRKLVIERDGGYCQRCYVKYKTFKVDELQVHHIKPRIDFPELVYDHNNLITICKQCNLDLGTQHELDFYWEKKDIDHKL